MAEIQETGGGHDDGKKGKQKKMSIRVDFTPMVDMNMLLITFFMLCTSLSKPQTMEISMPTKENDTDQDNTKVAASRAITLLLGEDDKVYYYLGEPNYADYTSLKETDFTSEGIRQVLLQRNANVVNQINELKKKKLADEITEDEFKTQSAEIKKDKDAPVVSIKGTDESNYKNLIDALDEMQICNISRYAIVPVAEGDLWLIKNLKSAGDLGRNSNFGGN